MSHLIKTTKGLDIQIDGAAEKIIGETVLSDIVALVPDYFHGITAKVLVKAGDYVKAGTPIFHDKTFENMNFVSPVSGKVLAVNRGEKRKLLNITIQREREIQYENFSVLSPEKLTAEEIKSALMNAGIWPYIKQRPYDVIANPNKTPKAIFISSFDTAPLAPDYNFILKGQFSDFQTGIDALAKLTPGKVHLGVKANVPSNEFLKVKNVEITEYEGPHPIGNVGIQINHVDPINKGEVVWTVNVQDVLYIGRFFNKGIADFKKIIALTGPEVIWPQYYKTLPGTSIEPFIVGNVQKGIPLRYISGNVLSGIKVQMDDFLDPYASQIFVIDEGTEHEEFLGWAMPRLNKFSASHLFPTRLIQKTFFKKILGKIQFQYDARLLGGRRAIIMSNEYDKVLPMDILPEFLFKAMITGNIDKMELLGGYEIAPEDVALCEYVCTSKLPLQLIVRQALDKMKKELE
jgi:Na+-transporting NADH:ubiquinone oxidoreductase subunit A